MTARMLMQVKLRSPNKDDTCSELVCMINNTRVRVGQWITLANSEEPERRWEVIWKSPELTDSTMVNRDWRVGGL